MCTDYTPTKEPRLRPIHIEITVDDLKTLLLAMEFFASDYSHTDATATKIQMDVLYKRLSRRLLRHDPKFVQNLDRMRARRQPPEDQP